ncbi:MAG: NAD(P)H-dependent oxidoreductase [Patescibacteria group bacterium]
MKISIICSSHRIASQSSKVSSFLENILKNNSVETYLLELAKTPLAFAYADGYADSNYSKKTEELLNQILPQLDSSQGFVFVVPEWSGMATPMLKNLILHLNHELAHKPILLVSISASRGGAFPIAELRLSGYKNALYNIIPEHLIIRNVNDVLNSSEINEQKYGRADTFIKKRINFALDLLLKYSRALEIVREDGLPLFELSENGMS